MRSLYVYLSMLMATLFMMGAIASASPVAQATPFADTLFDARADLDALADLVFEGEKPPEWTGNTDTRSETAVVDLWFDNEQLADELFGKGERPAGWFGTPPPNPTLIVRNTRHDLELSADAYFTRIGEPAHIRPDTWRGAAPIFRCERSLQNMLMLLSEVYNVTPTTPQSVLNYCASVTAELQDEFVKVTLDVDQQTRLPEKIWEIRGDLERLADERLGLNNRPPTWIGNTDINSPSLASDILLDMDTLADDLLGNNERPTNWIGVITNSPASTQSNLRFDLELLADTVLSPGERPGGWSGTEPLLRCLPMQQSIVQLAQLEYQFSPTTIDPSHPSYCDAISIAANMLVENPPVEDITEDEREKRFMAESKYAFAYLDVAALEYMGIMPGGTQFRAWYRNFADSNMMYVSGDNFGLFIDYRFTTLQQEIFDSLQTLEGVSPITFCDASWCNGPQPTPTPTGFGPLDAIIYQATPQATTPASEPGEITKTELSWNNLRINYIEDNLVDRVVSVTLEICNQPASIATACEAVNSVTDLVTGVSQESPSQVNGLNVYQFNYGYSTNLHIESETMFSRDIWISDPTIR